MIFKTINSYIIKLSVVVLLGVTSGSTLATVHIISDSNFTVLDPYGAYVDDDTDVYGSLDDSMLCNSVTCTLSGSMTLASNTPWFGFIPNWHDIRVFTEGTYVFDTKCTGADIAAGITDCSGGTPLTLSMCCNVSASTRQAR